MTPKPQTKPPEPILRLEDLRVDFESPRGTLKILEGVTFCLYPQEILALVGETGCGKSVTAKSMLDLIPALSRRRRGHVYFAEKDLLDCPTKQVQQIRGRDIAMIFQNPQSSINPVFTLGEQLFRLIRKFLGEEIAARQKHEGISRKAAVRRIAGEKMAEVGLTETTRLLKAYAHEISGGMAQRYKIAMALLGAPRVLIADEATSALDVTVQAHILKLLSGLARLKHTAILFITHDLGIAAQICDRIAVMYAGRVVEIGSTLDIFQKPSHPYTRGLLAAVPRLGQSTTLDYIPGRIPDLVKPPSGCRFHPRCAHVTAICREQRPAYRTCGAGHRAACHLYSA